MVNLYAAFCDDVLVFNSDYNRQSFLSGVEALLKKLPDLVARHLGEGMAQKAQVPTAVISAPRSDQPTKPLGTCSGITAGNGTRVRNCSWP